MGLIDTDGFGVSSGIESSVITEDATAFKENSFDSTVVDKVNPLVKYDVINKNYNLKKLLSDLGIETGGSNMYCPFHPDELTGKPSAKYHEDSDLLYCFSENKIYSAFHAIKLLYNIDTDRVFNDIWDKMDRVDKLEVLSKYGDSKDLVDSAASHVSSEWDFYRDSVLGLFKGGGITFRQYKNALYKIYRLMKSDNLAVKGGEGQ